MKSLDKFIKADKEWKQLRYDLSKLEQVFSAIIHSHDKSDGIDNMIWQQFLKALKTIATGRQFFLPYSHLKHLLFAQISAN